MFGGGEQCKRGLNNRTGQCGRWCGAKARCAKPAEVNFVQMKNAFEAEDLQVSDRTAQANGRPEDTDRRRVEPPTKSRSNSLNIYLLSLSPLSSLPSPARTHTLFLVFVLFCCSRLCANLGATHHSILVTR